MNVWDMERIEELTPLVRKIAKYFRVRMPDSVLDLDDLIQAGMIGLLDAMSKYEDVEGVAFAAYAQSRIRGEIVDEMRRHDPLARNVRKSVRHVMDAAQRLQQELGREPSGCEISGEADISLDEFHAAMSRGQEGEVTFTDLSPDVDILNFPCEREGPFDAVTESMKATALAQAIEGGESWNVEVIRRHIGGERFKDIGASFGLTESRACQMYWAGAEELKHQLADWA